MTQLKKADLEQMGEEYFQSLEPAQLMELAKDLHQLAMAQIDNRKQEYQSLMTASPVGILQTNLEGICTYANERYCEIVGVEATALIGRPWYKGYRSEDLARIVEEFEQSLRDDRPMRIEYRCQRPDGKETWVYGQSVVEYDTDGQAIGYVGTVTDISDRKAVELALEESEAHLSRLMGNLPGFVYRELNNSDYTPVYISPGVTAITGYLPEDYLIHRTVSCGKLIHPEDVDAVWESVQAALDANQSFKCEYRIINKAGQERWVWEKGQGTYDAAGELLYLEGFITDITDRKLAEIALHNLIEGTSATTGDDFFPALVSHIAAALDIAHVMVSELSGEDLNVQAFWSTDALQPTFSFPLANTPCERVCDEGIFYCESLVQQQFPTHLDLQAMEAQSYLGIALQSRDKHAIGNLCILDKKPIHNRPHAEKILRAFAARAAAELERLQAKRALEQLNQELEDRVAERTAALQESQKFIQKIATASPNIIYVHDIQETRNIYINREITETLGYTPDEVQVMGSRVLERLMHPEDFRQIDAHYHRMSTAQDGDILEIEYRMQHANGEWRWLISRDTIFRRNPRGEVEQIIGTAQDITDRKAAEKALMLKQTHLAALMNNIPHLAWLKDEQSRFIAVNEPFSQSCGVLAEELVGKTDYDIWPADLAQAYRDDDAEVLQSGQRKVVEERVLLANGILGWLETTKTPFTDSSGEFAGTVGIAANITDRKTMELALRESERRYASLAAAAPVAIFRFDTPLHCVYVNEQWSELSGRPMESALGHGWMEALHPDDREQSIAEWAAYYARSNPENLIIHSSEGRHLRPDGTTTWCYVQVAKEFDDDGNVVGYVGTLTDITDRKAAELALQESQAQFHRMTENVPGMIFRYVLHADGTDALTYVSSQIQEIFELEPQAAIQDSSNMWARIHPDDVIWLGDAIRSSAATLQPFSSAYRLQLPQKGLRWVQNMTHAERLENGDVVWDGIIVDISDRKTLEQEQAKLTAILEATPDYIGIANAQGELLWHNKQLKKLRPDLASYDDHRFVSDCHPDWVNQIIFEQALPMAIQEGSWSGETALLDGTGGEIPVSQVIIAHKSADGSVENFSTMMRDISDRKTMELALKASERRYASLAAAAPVAIFRFDTPLHCIYVNERWSQMCGRPAESALGYGWMDGLHPDDRRPNTTDWAEAYTQANPENPIIISGESRNLRPDGTITWCYVQVAQEFDDDGNVVGYIGTLTDISNRKATEQQLRDLSERLEIALKGANIGIWEWQIADDRLLWDDRMCALYGIEPEAFSGDYHDWLQRVHPDDREQNQRIQQQAINGERNCDAEFRIVRPDGSIRFISSSALIQRNEQGEVPRVIGVNLDITDRKQAQVKINQQMATIEAAINGIGILRGDTFIYANQSHLALYGYTSDELIGQSWRQLYSPTELARLEQSVFPILKRDRAWQGEVIATRKDGSWFYEGLSLTLTEDDLLICVCQDITDRKTTELALQESQAQFRRLVENVPGMIYQYVIDANGEERFTYVSPLVQEIYEVEPEAVLQDPQVIFARTHPEDLTILRTKIAASAQTLAPFSDEYRLITPSGPKWVKAISRPIPNDQGNLVWDGVVIDISDRKCIELELDKSRQKFYTLIQSVNGIVWEYDLTLNRFTFVSNKAEALFGYPIETWLTEPDFWQNHVYSDDLETVESMFEAAQQAQQSCELEYRMVAADGSLIWLCDISSPIVDKGHVTRTIGILLDIRDRKDYEQRLELTNAELLRATRLKDEFLANMSHELRTPLNVILGISEGLQEQILGPLNTRQIKALSSVQRSGSHLLSLINDVLDVAKIEAGQSELDISPISIQHLCKESLAFIKQPASQKQIHLEVNLPDDFPMLLVDERRIRQVLINLLSNAVKFTPEGGRITLDVDHLDIEDSPSTRNWVRFSIGDTGIGISPQNIAKLFQPFIQIDGALNRQYSGTGLGLTLAKGIVELHNGRIGVTSELGVGSCFTIDLPSIYLASSDTSERPNQEHYLDISNETDSPSPTSNQGISALILLVEDNEENSSTIADYLIAKGYRVLQAGNGIEAIALAQQYLPDVILMDIQMPEMDGLEAMTYIRSDPTLATVPVIALTALAMAGDRERCLKAGANEYISKPISLKQLVTIINQLLAV